MTLTTPLRLTILHFSQRTLTDGFTFIIQSPLIVPPVSFPSLTLQLGQDQRFIIHYRYGVLEMG